MSQRIAAIVLSIRQGNQERIFNILFREHVAENIAVYNLKVYMNTDCLNVSSDHLCNFIVHQITIVRTGQFQSKLTFLVTSVSQDLLCFLRIIKISIFSSKETLIMARNRRRNTGTGRRASTLQKLIADSLFVDGQLNSLTDCRIAAYPSIGQL